MSSVSSSGGVNVDGEGGWSDAVGRLGWWSGVVGLAAGGGLRWWVLLVVNGKWVYISAWSESRYVCVDSVYTLSCVVLLSI